MQPPQRPQPPEPSRWNWGSFLVYSVACFLGGLCAGVLMVPGVLSVIMGAGVGIFAARREWFEA